MRIAFTLGGTDAGRSGLGSYVKAVLPELSRVASRDGDELVAFGSAEELSVYAPALGGLETRVVPGLFTSSPGPNALWYLAMAGLSARLRAEADLVLYPAANRRLCAFNPVPSVAVVHDLAQLHVERKYDQLRTAYVRYGLTRVLRRVTRLVAISHATQSDLVSALGVQREHVDVVPNGVDVARFLPRPPGDAAVERARADLGLDGPYLLYPARLEHPAKNHVRLVEAYSRSAARSSHQLVLMGSEWGARERILRAVHEHGVADRVRLTGFLNEAVVPALVAGADGVVMVGLHEGFGLPALEALATGRLVCASETGALPEVVGELAVFCDPYSVSSISQALDRLVTDEDLRERARREGPAYAARRGWATTAEGLHRACRRARSLWKPATSRVRRGAQ